jgi:hypothetical protein
MNTHDYVKHILFMREWDVDYARWSLINHDSNLPWMGIKQAVKDKLNDKL